MDEHISIMAQLIDRFQQNEYGRRVCGCLTISADQLGLRTAEEASILDAFGREPVARMDISDLARIPKAYRYCVRS